MRSVSNRSTIRLGAAFDLTTFITPINERSQYAYRDFGWSQLNLSADFTQYSQLYSTFIPLYYKVKWVTNVQSNASGYYIPGGTTGNPPIPNAPIIYNMTDGFSTTRYDGVENPLSPNNGVQYQTFKTFNAARNWRTIVYPRRSQMTAPRQSFDSYTIGAANPPSNETIRGMGRLWLQTVVSWEDSNNVLPNTLNPSAGDQNIRLSQIGHLYIFFYCKVYDRK